MSLRNSYAVKELSVNSKYKIPSISIISLFEEKKPTISLPNGLLVDASALKYTILDEENVYRDILSLAELYCAFGVPPRELVSYKPTRIGLHEIIVAVETRLQVTDQLAFEKPFQLLVNKIYQGIKKSLESEQEILRPERVNLQARVSEFVTLHSMQKDYIPIDSDFVGFSLQETLVIKKVYAAANQRRFSDKPPILGQYLKRYNWESAIIDRVTDCLFTQIASQRINDLVNKYIDSLIESKQLMPLDIPAANSRYTFMVTGGTASGKGYSVEEMKYSTEKMGISWSNVAKINTDDFKPLVCPQEKNVEPILYSQLSRDEASFINTKILNRLMEMALNGTAPHVFFDQVFVNRDQLNFGKTSEYKHVYIVVVAAEIKNCLERSFTRGQQTGRYECSSTMINTHRNMAIELPEHLKEVRNNKASLKIIDNNKIQAPPYEIANINCQEGVINIYDADAVRRFIHKTAINCNAQSDEDLYTQPIDKMDIEHYFKPLQFKIVYESKHISSEESNISHRVRPR